MIKRLTLAAVVVILAAGAVFLITNDAVEAQGNCTLRAVTGTVDWIRVNNVGTGFGPQNDFIDGEVIFQLNNGERYGFQLRANQNALVAQGALTLLTQAMSNNWRIEVDFDDCGGNNNEVQFGRIRAIK